MTDILHNIPAMETDPARIEQGRRLFCQPCQFVRGASKLEECPPLTLPEFAFMGRSNVGKSSLLNALVSQHRLARTSRTPGRTQALYFFTLGKTLTLVDMPGYGYAAAPLELTTRWHELIFHYLRTRPLLQRTYLLIDARHALKSRDRQTMRQLDAAAISYQIILTKCDKIRPAERTARIEALHSVASDHPAMHPTILAVSSKSGMGLPQLRALLVHETGTAS